MSPGCLEYDLKNICRSCLRQSSKLKSVFDIARTENDEIDNWLQFGDKSIPDEDEVVVDDQFTINQAIFSCTQIEISKDDGMPLQICLGCVEEVRRAYTYKRKCLQSDQTLRRYLQQRKLVELVDLRLPDIEDIKREEEFGGHRYTLIHVEKSELTEDIVNVDLNLSHDPDFAQEEDNSIQLDDSDYIRDLNPTNEILFVQNDIMYRCHLCEMVMKDGRSLRLHMRGHTIKGTDILHKNQQQKDLPNSHPKNKCNEIYMLGTKNGAKSIICSICDRIFSRISELRSHLSLNSPNSCAFWEVKLGKKQELFAQNQIDVAATSHEDLVKWIQTQLQSKQFHWFYRIVNDSGWEMSLSDSETDDDDSTVRSQYECTACEKCFDRQYRLVQHMQNDHRPEEFSNIRCLNCSIVFPCKTILDKHLKKQCANTTKKYRCEHCGIRFMYQDTWNDHIQRMHANHDQSTRLKVGGDSSENYLIKQKTIICDVCSKEFKRNSHLKRHRQVHTKNKMCNEHIQRMHANRLQVGGDSSEISPIQKKTFICDVCSKHFNRNSHLERHLQVHAKQEKQFICDICNKKFNRKDNLKCHMRKHGNDKKEKNDKHLCVYCGRSFTNSSNLVVHMRRHTGEKPYKCDICDKGFPRSSDLRCHRMTHTGEKPCLCTICGKGFSRSNKLVRHMRVHTGDRPYKCTYCDRAFTQTNDLTLHIRRHTGDKPYVCGVCGDRFIQGTALQVHRRQTGHHEDGQSIKPTATVSSNNPTRVPHVNRENRNHGGNDGQTMGKSPGTIVMQTMTSSPAPSYVVNGNTTLNVASFIIAPFQSGAEFN